MGCSGARRSSRLRAGIAWEDGTRGVGGGTGTFEYIMRWIEDEQGDGGGSSDCDGGDDLKTKGRESWIVRSF